MFLFLGPAIRDPSKRGNAFIPKILISTLSTLLSDYLKALALRQLKSGQIQKTILP